MSDFDEIAAAKRCARMWRRVGGLLEKTAYEAAGKSAFGPNTALRLASAADVCFWQATGVMEPLTVKELSNESEAGK